jgi:hypothetical protein
VVELTDLWIVPEFVHMQFGVWMSHRGLEYRSIRLDSLDSVRIKGNKLGKDRNQKAVQSPWRMVSFGESG